MIVPDRRTFETMISSLCEAGKLDMTLHSSNESMSYQFVVDAAVLQGVVHGPVNELFFKKGPDDAFIVLCLIGRSFFSLL